MKYCRFQTSSFSANEVDRSVDQIHPDIRNGIIEGNEVREIRGEFWDKYETAGPSWPLNSVKLLPPCTPSKIVCVGRNYAEHAKEFAYEVPQDSMLFFKTSTSVIRPDEPIVIPRISKRVD